MQDSEKYVSGSYLPDPIQEFNTPPLPDPTSIPVGYHTHNGIDSPELDIGDTDPAGSSTEIQFNDSGVFGADSDFTWNKTTDVLTLGNNAEIRAKGVSYTLGSELVTNGNFTGNATGWTLGAGWAYNSNNVLHTAGNTAALSQNISVLDASTYRVTLTVTGTAGDVDISLGDGAGDTATFGGGSGVCVFYLAATVATTGNISIVPTTDFDGTIDTVSVKLLTGSLDDGEGLFVYGGTALDSGNAGGGIYLTAGSGDGGADGGNLELVAGTGGGIAGAGGDVLIDGGDALANSEGSGGAITLTAGNASGSTLVGGDGGDITFTPGDGYGSSYRNGDIICKVPTSGQASSLPSRFILTNNLNTYSYRILGETTTTSGAAATYNITEVPQAILVEARVVGYRTGGTGGAANDSAAYVRRALYKTGPTLIGSIQDDFTAESQAGWDCTFTTSGSTLQLQVTGAANNNVSWRFEIFFTAYSSGIIS